MEPLFSLGQWLKRRRKARDLTQDALAQRVGCSLETIRKIEADARRPSRQIAERLAEHLGLAPDERTTFLQAARAELSAERLPSPARSVPQPALLPTAAAPSGTVTFLFSDIVGSTRLWQQHPHAMGAAVARHELLLRVAITGAGGVVFKTVGDGLCAAFASARAAVTAALAGQRALIGETWGATGPLQVRMALHTGVVEEHAGDYVGLPLSRIARMLAVAHGGQVLLSHVTHELVRDQPPPDTTLRDLGAHRLKDLARAEPLFQLVAPGLPSDFPALPSLDARHTNLPAQPTALIGREREVADVTALLRRPDVRLVTLTGPGGTGKTRLAFQVAAELLDDSAAGVYVVNLAPVREAATVVMTIAQTLGVPESGNQPILDLLKAYLRDKRLVLLLDNFEQVLDAALRVSELLAAAPALKVLVTSRAVLHLQGEHEVAVSPLALPDLAHLPPLAQLTQYAAVALFIARAQAAQASFAVTNATAPAVAEICVRVDGLPLALELAAARIKLFPPEALLAHLEHRLQLLTSGPRDLPQRQQTMRNTIGWSYDLLNEGEQRQFRRLGVFVGGCTLEAAEAVCNTTGDLPLAMVDGVAALVDQSLLRQGLGTDGEPRFLMLETIHEFARERLAEQGELEAMQHRHASYFLELATDGEPVGGEGEEERDAAWYARRTADIDNLRAVLAWSHAAPDGAEIELRLVGALFWLWVYTGAVNEADVWITHALERSASASTFAQVKLVRAAGWVAYMQGAYAQASTLHEQELVLWRQIGDRANIAFCLLNTGRMARNQGQLTRARPISGLEKMRRQPDLAAVASKFIPALGLQDDPASAVRLFELATIARGEHPPSSLTFQRGTRVEIHEEVLEHRSQLPLPPTPLLGRDQDVEQLCKRLLGHGGRLLTLVGPPGIGKTRLALAMAERAQYHYTDGAVFVPLAAIAEQTLMAATILAALGSDEGSAKPPAERLIASLRPKHILLVLDNCEQIVGASSLIAELLAACPRLHILATSRERLHLRAEQRYRVPPLELDTAVALFAECAYAVNADFALTPVNRPTVEAICQRLDRLPLAIELCAAQVDLLAPHHILAQLHTRPLDLLEDGAHDLPPQQRTLRNAIQRSYDLLTDDERTLFRAGGVFVGGCDLAALKAVSAWEDAEHTRSLLSTLHTLIGKSLVRAETTPIGDQRFKMLETLREFALEQLRAYGNATRLRRAYVTYFIALVEPDARNVEPPPPLAWFKNVEEEYDNLRAALAWSVDHDQRELALRLSVALGYFWLEKGYWTEGRGWLEAALRQTSQEFPAKLTAFRAQALRWAAWLAFTQGDIEAARTFGEQALDAFRALEDPLLLAHALVVLSAITCAHGDLAAAVSVNEEALALYRALDERKGIATVLNNMGWQAYLAGDDRAQLLLEQGLREGRASGLDCTYGLNSLAFVLMERGDYRRARELLVAGIQEARVPRNKEILIPYLEGFACLATLEGALRGEGATGARRAARCFGAAEAQREEIGATLPAIEAALRARHIAVARPYLDQEAWETAWREGWAMTVEQAVAYALDASDTVITR